MDFKARKPARHRKGPERFGMVRQVYTPRGLNQRTGGYIGKEIKFYDTTVVNSVLTNTWQLHQVAAGLSAVARGDGPRERDGRQFNITALNISGDVNSIINNDSVPKGDMRVRIVYFVDHQTNGALPVPLDVMELNNLDSFRNLENVKRFTILYDKQHIIEVARSNNVVPSSDDFVWPETVVHYKFNKNFRRPIVVNMKDTTQVIANIFDNSLHCMAITSQTGNSAAHISYQSRLRFVG